MAPAGLMAPVLRRLPQAVRRHDADALEVERRRQQPARPVRQHADAVPTRLRDPRRPVLRRRRGVSLKFEVAPARSTTGSRQASLDVDGQDLTYSHGPVQPMRMQWPGPAGRNVVRLTFTPVSGRPRHADARRCLGAVPPAGHRQAVLDPDRPRDLRLHRRRAAPRRSCSPPTASSTPSPCRRCTSSAARRRCSSASLSGRVVAGPRASVAVAVAGGSA